MGERVTIQDIADALGLSRNTVSKAINNTGILADATKEKILQKAMEMGYKTFSMNNTSTQTESSTSTMPSSNREIALFTGKFIGNSHFSSTMLDKLQYELDLMGYSISFHRVTEDNFTNNTLPLTFNKEIISGIICLEIFDLSYCQLLESLNIPLLLVDAPVASYGIPLRADLLLMQNTAAIFQLVQVMASRGITKIGFVGQKDHCRSFFERYMAFRDAMHLNQLPIDEKFCLTKVYPHDGGYLYREHLRLAIEDMEELPQLFICCNDFACLDLLDALRSRNIKCPEDILIFGFDDSQESKIVTPKLSTCHIHSQIMGLEAARLLISRIENPDMNYRIVHTETTLILRESTEGTSSGEDL